MCREKEKRRRSADGVRGVYFYGMQLEIDVLLTQVEATSIQNKIRRMRLRSRQQPSTTKCGRITHFADRSDRK